MASELNYSDFDIRTPPQFDKEIAEAKQTGNGLRELREKLDQEVEIKWPNCEWQKLIEAPTHPSEKYLVSVRHFWLESEDDKSLHLALEVVSGTDAIN